jgi:hypothetical protein
MVEVFAAGFAAYMGMGILGMSIVGGALAIAIIGAFMEKGVVAFLAIAAMAAGLFQFANFDVLGTASAHPWITAASIGGYFFAGAIWSLFKFRLYAGRLKGIFSEHKARWLADAGVSAVEALDPAQMSQFRKDSKERMNNAAKGYTYPLQPSRMKSDILFWMGWWPVSILAYLLDDPIKGLLEAIYNTFSGLYAKIAKDQAAEYLADMGK